MPQMAFFNVIGEMCQLQHCVLWHTYRGTQVCFCNGSCTSLLLPVSLILSVYHMPYPWSFFLKLSLQNI